MTGTGYWDERGEDRFEPSLDPAFHAKLTNGSRLRFSIRSKATHSARLSSTSERDGDLFGTEILALSVVEQEIPEARRSEEV